MLIEIGHFRILTDPVFSKKGNSEAIKILNPYQVIPIHYEGWTHFKDGKEKIKNIYLEKNLTNTIHWLELGKRTAIPI